MQKIYINRHWKFNREYKDKYITEPMEEAEDVTVPHTVAVTPLNYFDESDYQMLCCYQRTFEADASWKENVVILTFEAVAHEANVYVNGEHVAVHRSGYTAFSADISDVIRYDAENLITVKVDTRENLNQPPFGFVVDYMTYGGIYRDVYITVKDKVNMSEVFYQPKFVAPPSTRGMKLAELLEYKTAGQLSTTMELSDEAVKLANEHRLFVRQFLDGKQISMQPLPKDGWTTTLAGDVSLWDINNPVRYEITTELIVDDNIRDRHTAMIGFREMIFRKEGFFLNGRKIKLRGLNRHQSFPYVGYAMPESMQREDARILKEELGLNAVRTSHYPQSQYFMDECDARGLLVFTEIPGWQHIGDDAWKDIAVQNVREMVIQYRNHPSVMLWGVRINESQDDDIFYRRTNDAAHELDPTRPTGGVRAGAKMSLLEDVYTYNDFSHNGTNAGCQPKEKVTPDNEKPYFISEFNGHMFPTKSYDCEEHRQEHAMRHATVLDAVAKEEDIAGAFGWCMFDYNTHKDFGSGDRVCYHGVMDMFRNPKLAASVYASQSDREPVLEITSTMDIGEHPASVRGFSYIITNADSVRMYKNGAFIKEYKPENSPFEGLKHPPMPIDDFVGDTMMEQEGYGKLQNELVRTCLNETAIHGYRISPKIFFAALRLIVFHGMKPNQAVELFQKYIGDWGGQAKEYRFEAIRRGDVVKTITKAAVNKVYITAVPSARELKEGVSYDVASVRISACDEYGNVLPFYGESLRIVPEGPIELIGPACVSFRGGMTGTYIKTTGRSGEASLKLYAEGAEPVAVYFNITADDKEGE